MTVDPDLAHERPLPASPQIGSMALGQEGDHVGAQVVAGAGVFGPGVAQPDDDEVGRLAGARRRRGRQGLGLGCGVGGLDCGNFGTGASRGFGVGRLGVSRHARALGQDHGLLGIEVGCDSARQGKVAHPDGVA